MRQSKAEIYLHFVWATVQRQPLVTPDVERAIHRCIESETQRLGCVILAIGGVQDHIHLLVKIPPRISPLKMMHQVKGVSSHFIHERQLADESFRWQEGYGVFSVGCNEVQCVMAYITNQKRHHADGSICEDWEKASEESIKSSSGKVNRSPSGR